MVNTTHSLSFVHFPCEICSSSNNNNNDKADNRRERQDDQDPSCKIVQKKAKLLTTIYPRFENQWSVSEERSEREEHGNEKKPPLMMSKIDVETHCVVIIGELSVGKSALCRKFFANGRKSSYGESSSGHHHHHHLNRRRASAAKIHEREIAIDDDDAIDEQAANHHIYERPVTVGHHPCRLRILDINTERHLIDCCHDDQFANVKSYIGIGDAFIVAYAVTDWGTFETAREILEKIVGIVERAPVILVGNKCDLVRKRQVSLAEGIELAEEHGVKFVETSANLNLNIDKLFEGTIKQIRLRNKEKLLTVGGGQSYDLKKKRKSKVSLGSLNFGDSLKIVQRAHSTRNSLTSSSHNNGGGSFRRSTASSSSMTSSATSCPIATSSTSPASTAVVSPMPAAAASPQKPSSAPKRSKSFFKRCKSKLRKSLSGGSKKCQDLSVL